MMEKLPFRWRYVAAPLVLCAASLLLAAYFYPRLEGTRIASHFNLRGEPNGWMSRQAFVLIMVAIQVGFAAVSIVLARWTSSLLRPGTPGQIPGVASQWLLGNILAIGQIIVLFVMADTFWYNLHHAHLLPVWLFIIIAVVIAAMGPMAAIGIVVGSRVLGQATKKSDEPESKE